MEDHNIFNFKENKNNLIVIALATLLVLLTIVFFWQRSTYQADAALIKADKDSIATELTKMVSNYNSIKSENDSLNMTIGYAQSKVKDLLTEVEQVKNASYKQISQYRKEVTTLRGIMRDYIVQIDSLNQKNQRLMAENLNVKQQVTEAKTENKQLQVEKKKLEQTVTLAAQLEATGLRAYGISTKGKEMTRSGRIEKIKIDFSLSKNLTAKRGSKNLYVRIQRPDQLLLMKSEKDLFKFEDMKIPYSAMREVEYEGEELQVSIYWDNSKSTPLVSGRYAVDIFADGRNIGTTSFDVK